MDLERLGRARIRPARTEKDLLRAEACLQTRRMREIVEGHPDERGCVRICEEGGEILGALLLDPSPLRLRGVDVRCARIVETAGEDGRKHFRKTGDDALFILLVEEFLGYLWGRRYPLAFVHGELALFPEHGFVPCFYHPRVYLNTEVAMSLPARYRVRHLKSDDLPTIARIREQHVRSKPSVYASGVPMFHHFSVEAPNREIRGYFSLEVDPDSKWNPAFFAPEVDGVDREALFAILSYCASKARPHGIEQLHFPVAAGHPMGRVCLELGGYAVLRGAATDPRVDEEMLHVVDHARLLETLAPWFEERLIERKAQHLAASIPIDTGPDRWTLRVDAGAVSLTRRADDEPGVEIPHWALTQLIVGYRAADEIQPPLPDEVIRVLDLLFPKVWPYSSPDPDHWEAVDPPAPYSGTALDRVLETRLPWLDDW
ncbi:MAG: hypothetical protein ACYTEG_09740 [Planctomycetota bacterium]|jgi:hypothetical protein